jgi:hypothetical protein
MKMYLWTLSEYGEIPTATVRFEIVKQENYPLKQLDHSRHISTFSARGGGHTWHLFEVWDAPLPPKVGPPTEPPAYMNVDDSKTEEHMKESVPSPEGMVAEGIVAARKRRAPRGQKKT